MNRPIRILLALCLIFLLIGCAPANETSSTTPIEEKIKSTTAANESHYVSDEHDQTETATTETEYEVLRVIDGDTFIIDYNGKEERVRMIGIDTPEITNGKNEPYGKEARDFTKKALEGQKVHLELDVEERDKYGRILAYVYLEDRLINAELLQQGLAQVMTIPPNVKYSKDFAEIQQQARKNKVGVWQDQ